MMPIVNRLTETYSDEVSFVQLNATTDGAEIFEQLGLRGHPALVILLPDRAETFRALGIQEENRLIDEIESAILDVEADNTD